MSVVKMRPRTFPEKHPCSRCLKTGSTFDISITHLPGSLAVGLAIWSTPQTPCTGPRAPSLAPVSVGRRRLTAPPFRRLPWLAGAPAPWRDRHPGEEAQSLRQTPGPRPSHASRPSSVCPSSGASPPPPAPGITARGAPAAPGPASVLRRAATASSGLRFSTKPAETADSPQNAQRRKHFWARTICATEFAESRDGGARAPAPLWRMVCLSLTGAEALWSDR